jgi:hypothetical protein
MKDCRCRLVRVLGAERGARSATEVRPGEEDVDGKARQGRCRLACIGEKRKAITTACVQYLLFPSRQERYQNYRRSACAALPTTVHTPSPPTSQGPPVTQGQAPRIPGPYPGYSPALSGLRGLRGWKPPAAGKGWPWQSVNLPGAQRP